MQKNSSVAHILLIALLVTWGAYSGQRQICVALVWLALMALTLGLVFPAAKKGESEADARGGAWRRLACDPFLALAVAALLFFFIQAVNGGRALAYDPIGERWAFSLPAWRWGPSSVVAANAWLTTAYALVVTSVCLTVRQTMGKQGKLLLLQGMSLSAAALSLWTIVRLALVAEWQWLRLPTFFFTADPSAVGAHYVLMAAISCGLAMDAGMRGRFSSWMTIPVVLNLAGIGLSRSPAAIMVGWAFVVAGGFYAARYAWPSLSSSQKIKSWVFGILPILLAGFVYFGLYPGNRVLQAVQASGSWESFLTERAQGDRAAADAAFRVWSDHRWVGVGPRGFEYFAPLYGVSDPARADGRVGQDFVEYLCEYGVVGCSLVALAWGCVVAGNYRRLALVRYVTSGSAIRPDRCWLLRMTPMAVFLCLGTGWVCCLSAGDTVFHSPAVSFPWCVAVTCLGTFLPMRKVV